MWTCPKCNERQEPSFDICWNCGAQKEDAGTSAFAPPPEGGNAPNSSSESTRTGSSEAGDRGDLHAPDRTLEQLVFVGLNGYALALDRDTGEIVWSNNEMRSGYVTLLLDGDRLIVSTNGYLYCLDPLTGAIRWHNPLTGYGMGSPTSLISVRGQSSAGLVQQAADVVARSSNYHTRVR